VKELSPETRALLALTLSIAIFAVWSWIYKPVAPQRPQQPATPAPSGAEGSREEKAGRGETAAAPAPRPSEPRAAAQESTTVVETKLYRAEFSNRGGVVRSWQLKKYRDDRKPPRTLDVVHAEAAAQLSTWPLSLALADPELEQQVNSALYIMSPPGPLRPEPSGGELRFLWSNGRLEVIKRLKFNDQSYVVEMETSVLLEGKPLAHAVAWRGGFGDETVYNAAEKVEVFYHANGKLDALPLKKLGAPDQRRLRYPGTVDYAGIEDAYFAAAFLPRGTGLALWHWKQAREVEREGSKQQEQVAEMAAGSTVAGPLALRLFVGPKDFEVLGSLNPPMTELVNFGDWLGWIARPLFRFLKWTYGYVPNYGWAIVLMTVIINMVLFPLKLTGWRSMQKMQKVGPEIKSIQERYKKYGLRDPRRQKMNEEVMAVYRREGINPMGSCWPMAVQMPIWFALYRMLNVAIELRHAPWLWIRDLSAKDPYLVLPVTMAVTMYLMQKMTPATTADPAQQRMMQLMPIMFGGMFVIFPISSGLVLYILTSNLVGMAQQWYLNRSAPAPARRGGRGRAREEDDRGK